MFIDANVFIHAYLSKTGKGEQANALLERISSGEQKASTSPLVLDEVIYTLWDERGFDTAKKAWTHLLSLQNLSLLPIDDHVVSRVLGFMELGLEPRDAFHAATMRANGLETICSYDKGFDRVTDIRRQEPK